MDSDVGAVDLDVVAEGAFYEQRVAPGIVRLGIVFVNAYLVGDAVGAAGGTSWVLVDSGLPFSAPLIRRAARERFGTDARPGAIVLTHGHFDHAGSALALASRWDVPVYAHPLELPYLTGKSNYPPQDPAMGGAIAQMARMFPHTGYDLGGRARPLPEDGSVPGMEVWRWLHTPGHTPGHVSLFRDEDRVLLAGDALATMDLDSWRSQLTRERGLHRPPAPFTTDWEAAKVSVGRLSGLEPSVIAAGHGLPVAGPQAAGELRRYANHFTAPPVGRYVSRPARADEEGVKDVPPPVPDPLPGTIAATVVGAAAGAVITSFAWRRRRP